MNVSNFLPFALVLFASVAHADWSHVQFLMENHSRNQIHEATVNVDYIVETEWDKGYKPQHRNLARPLYVNVNGHGLDGNQKVRAVLNNYEGTDFSRYFTVPLTYVWDLTWQGNHYSGEIGSAHVNRSHYDYGSAAIHPLEIFSWGYGGNRHFHQTLSIVVDGEWLKVPASLDNDYPLVLNSK
jgi:hypothetical protein